MTRTSLFRGTACLTTCVVAGLTALNACDDSTTMRPDCCSTIAAPESAVVSEPLSSLVAAASLRSLSLNEASAGEGTSLYVGAAERLVYVSLPSGAYPTGTTAVIRNTAGGPIVSQPMLDGGFDPIAIPAGVGDTVAIEIRSDGILLASIARAVPRSRRPGVVRTNPPKGKRDVALNSRVTIIFSEPIAANSLTASSITLSRNGTPIPGLIEVLAGGLAAEFVPSAALEPNSPHRVLLTRDIRDVEGDALEAEVTVEFTTGTTTRPPVTSVDVAPPSATLEVGDVLGDSVQLSAAVQSAQGALADREVIWSTGDPSVAVVSSRGLVMARGPGVATITATSEGEEGTAQITVVPMPVARINIGPLNPTVRVGGTIFLNALTLDRNNAFLSRRTRVWESGDASIAIVNQRGLVTGMAAGTTTITVTSEGVSATTTIAVGIPLLIDRVDIDPPAMAVGAGGSQQLTARAYRCNVDIGGCSEITGHTIRWSSPNSAVATVDQTGRLTAVGAGMVGITATVDEVQGLVPVTVLPPTPLTFNSLSTGNQSTCGVTANGEAYCWGDNYFGQLGVGQLGLGQGMRPPWTPATVAPVAVSGGLTFASVNMGGWHTCGLTSSGDAYCWGLASGTRLGRPGPFGTAPCEVARQTDTVRSPCDPTPTLVPGVPRFRAVSAGGGHTCALTADGAAYCWGSDWYGQIGDGGGVTSHGLPPTPVVGGHAFASVSVGYAHVCGVTLQGKAYCWGYNNSGQLGDGSSVNRDVPAPVAGDLTFASVSAGEYHTCGVTTSSDAYCWGDNFYGQLGDGSYTRSYVPVAVSGGPFTQVDASLFYTCGLSPSGVAYCWGGHWEGALGDGSGSTHTTPALVAGGLTFAAITVGGIHACGLTTDHVAYCWGWNLLGQLGDGSATNRNVPVAVTGQP